MSIIEYNGMVDSMLGRSRFRIDRNSGLFSCNLNRRRKRWMLGIGHVDVLEGKTSGSMAQFHARVCFVSSMSCPLLRVHQHACAPSHFPAFVVSPQVLTSKRGQFMDNLFFTMSLCVYVCVLLLHVGKQLIIIVEDFMMFVRSIILILFKFH